MMTTAKWLLPAAVFIVVIAGCRSDIPETEAFGNPTPQARTERAMRAFFGAAVDTIGAPIPGAESDATVDSQAVFQPLSVQVDADDAVFVLDRSDMKIKKYDGSGRFVRSFGKGVGQGPGEFEFLMAFALSESGDVLALDGRARHVTRFDSLGNIVNRFTLPRQGDGLAALPDGRILAKLVGPGALFRVFDAEGNPQSRESGPVFDSIEQSFPLVGQTTSTPSGDIVFSPMYEGSIARFNDRLDLQYHVQAIEPSPMPGVEMADGSFSLNTNLARGTYVPITATSDTVYTLFFSRETQRGYLDVYHNADGAYAYSAELPDDCYPVAITGTHAYLICNQIDVVKVERGPTSASLGGGTL